jgi:predicted nuclease of predicted toxin-antitoxin system
MPLKFYLDENVDVSVAAGLRLRGIDVVTARDREKLGASDEEHLTHARAEGRIVVTHDIADFVRIHQQWVAAGTPHAGIALSNIVPPGVLLKRLLRLCESMSEAEGHLIFLGQFAD